MKRFILIPFVMLLTVVFFTVSCTKKTGEALRVCMTSFGSETFDPIVLNSPWLDLVYDAILWYDANGNVIPYAAESYNLSKDGKTWTFKVRKGVKFHNGDEMTSADFDFSFKRFISEENKNPWAGSIRESYENMEATDDYTFVFRTKKPDPLLTAAFASVHILSKKYIEANGIEHFRANPIGTGPWKNPKLISGASCEFEAVDGHWRLTPSFKKLFIELVPEEATKISKLKTGETDIIEVSLDNAAELKKEGWNLQAMLSPSVPVVTFPGIWLTKGPTSDIKVRMAMSFAINRQEICDTFFRGFADPGGYWYMSASTWGWDPKWKADPYDLDKAKALLKEAGYPDNFENPVIKVYSMPMRGGAWLPDYMQILAGYWEAAGIKLQIEPITSQQFISMFFVRGSEGIIGTAAPFVTVARTNNVYHSKNLLTSKGIHTTGNDPKLDKLYDELTVELDEKKAKEKFREMYSYARSLYIVTGEVQLYNQIATGPKVDRFTTDLNIGLWQALAGVQPK